MSKLLALGCIIFLVVAYTVRHAVATPSSWLSGLIGISWWLLVVLVLPPLFIALVICVARSIEAGETGRWRSVGLTACALFLYLSSCFGGAQLMRGIRPRSTGGYRTVILVTGGVEERHFPRCVSGRLADIGDGNVFVLASTAGSERMTRLRIAGWTIRADQQDALRRSIVGRQAFAMFEKGDGKTDPQSARLSIVFIPGVECLKTGFVNLDLANPDIAEFADEAVPDWYRYLIGEIQATPEAEAQRLIDLARPL